jgi:hypothetical protein
LPDVVHEQTQVLFVPVVFGHQRQDRISKCVFKYAIFQYEFIDRYWDQILQIFSLFFHDREYLFPNTEPHGIARGNQLKEFRQQRARVHYALVKKFPTPLAVAGIDAN